MTATLTAELRELRSEYSARIDAIDKLLGIDAPSEPDRASGAEPKRRGRKPRKTVRMDSPATKSSTEPVGVTDLVREAINHIVVPFSRVEVIDWIEKHYPERMAEIKPAAVDCVLNRFRKTGELVEAGERKGLTGMLTLMKLGRMLSLNKSGNS